MDTTCTSRPNEAGGGDGRCMNSKVICCRPTGIVRRNRRDLNWDHTPPESESTEKTSSPTPDTIVTTQEPEPRRSLQTGRVPDRLDL